MYLVKKNKSRPSLCLNNKLLYVVKWSEASRNMLLSVY